MCLIKPIPITSEIPIMSYRQMGVVVRDGQMLGIPSISPMSDEYEIDNTSGLSDPARLYSTCPKDFGYHTMFLHYGLVDTFAFVPTKVQSLKEGVQALGVYSVLIHPKHLMYTDFEDITSNYFYLNPTPIGIHEHVLYTPLLWDRISCALWVDAQEVNISYSGDINVIMDDNSVHTFKTRDAVIPYEKALQKELRRNRKVGHIITLLWQRNRIKSFLSKSPYDGERGGKE